jgi:poly(3-hydroxybutyrate) depolymerase
VPQGAAHDVASAFSAMHHGPTTPGPSMPMGSGTPSTGRDRSRAHASASGTRRGVPTIVFHGDADGTVHPRNGDHVIDAALRAAGHDSEQARKTSVKASAAGRAFTKTVHRHPTAPADDTSLAEHWVVHGAGHAWSGGSPTGSYSDPTGPDASREMIRFFEEHPLRRPKATR